MDVKEEENLRRTLIELAILLATMGVQVGMDYLKGRSKEKKDSPDDAEDNADG